MSLMNYRNPRFGAALAAEYVFGTLHGPARRRFERALVSEPSLRAEVYFWELRLGELNRSVPPVSPPAEVWASLRAGMQPAGAPVSTVVPLRMPNPAPRRVAGAGGRSWRVVMGLATAAALVLAVHLGQDPTVSRDDSGRRAVGAETRTQETPIYVTLLKVPASNVQWLVSLSPDQREINVVAAGDYAQLGQRKVQLWWISPRLGPVALGQLPSRSGDSADIMLPSALDQDAGSGFDLAVSLEPEGSSPRDLPDGPVVTWARNLTTQRERDSGI